MRTYPTRRGLLNCGVISLSFRPPLCHRHTLPGIFFRMLRRFSLNPFHIRTLEANSRSALGLSRREYDVARRGPQWPWPLPSRNYEVGKIIFYTWCLCVCRVYSQSFSVKFYRASHHKSPGRILVPSDRASWQPLMSTVDLLQVTCR